MNGTCVCAACACALFAHAGERGAGEGGGKHGDSAGRTHHATIRIDFWDQSIKIDLRISEIVLLFFIVPSSSL